MPANNKIDSLSHLLVKSLVIGLFIGLFATITPVRAEDDDLPIRFNAIAQNLSNVGPRGQARLQINVTRWTTAEEGAAVMEALKAGSESRGTRTLADALFEQEIVGTFRESRSMSENLRYSRRTKTEGGQRIILATDRPLAFAEVWRSARTTDYNVTLIILEVDEDGRGEGQIMVGADLSWDDANNQVSITNFASEPIRLTNVRLR
jgi:hypothetical protein